MYIYIYCIIYIMCIYIYIYTHYLCIQYVFIMIQPSPSQDSSNDAQVSQNRDAGDPGGPHTSYAVIGCSCGFNVIYYIWCTIYYILWYYKLSINIYHSLTINHDGWCQNYRTEVEEYEGTVIYRTLLFHISVFLGKYEKKLS